MPEYRTLPLNRQSLLDELEFVTDRLMQSGIKQANVSFGWDCNLPIDEMWQDHSVGVVNILQFVGQAEKAGTVNVGKGDIFVEVPGFRLTLCHEGDAHVAGATDLVRTMVERWERLSYEPYEAKPQT